MVKSRAELSEMLSEKDKQFINEYKFGVEKLWGQRVLEPNILMVEAAPLHILSDIWLMSKKTRPTFNMMRLVMLAIADYIYDCASTIPNMVNNPETLELMQELGGLDPNSFEFKQITDKIKAILRDNPSSFGERGLAESQKLMSMSLKERTKAGYGPEIIRTSCMAYASLDTTEVESRWCEVIADILNIDADKVENGELLVKHMIHNSKDLLNLYKQVATKLEPHGKEAEYMGLTWLETYALCAFDRYVMNFGEPKGKKMESWNESHTWAFHRMNALRNSMAHSTDALGHN